MRSSLCLLALLAPTVALADSAYLPRFARDEQPAQVLATAACTEPVYPPLSLRAKNEGTTSARATIGADGRLIDMRIVRSSGYRDLDRAFLQSFARCQLRPASLHGQPVQTVLNLQHVWKVQ